METTKSKSLLWRSVLGLEEKELGDLKRRNVFHQHFSPLFLAFSHELISFSRIVMQSK